MRNSQIYQNNHKQKNQVNDLKTKRKDYHNFLGLFLVTLLIYIIDFLAIISSIRNNSDSLLYTIIFAVIGVIATILFIWSLVTIIKIRMNYKKQIGTNRIFKNQRRYLQLKNNGHPNNFNQQNNQENKNKQDDLQSPPSNNFKFYSQKANSKNQMTKKQREDYLKKQRSFSQNHKKR
mgnify:CR=1 FL=1